jgi:hypothetical protein
MSQRKIRCTVFAAAFAAVLTLAAPVQAASHPRIIPSSGWLEAVWQWVGGIWGGGAASTGTPTHNQKAAQGSVIAPGSDSTATTQPANDKGLGVDPNG